jgi:myo-inositol-1(or 4)-monophosphatase
MPQERTPLEVAIDAARQTSRILMRHFRKLDKVDFKGVSRNLVTVADRESEAFLRDMLLGAFPEHTMLGEEDHQPDQSKEYCWIVDPLDGTTNFVHGFPHFAVSIALAYRDSIQLGVVYDPNRDELFHAERGGGAFLNGVPIAVSETAVLQEALLATGFPYDPNEAPLPPLPLFSALVYRAQGIRRCGSAALDLCYVACGRVDGFWEVTLGPWDVAAGLLIIEEAGGTVTDLAGSALDIYHCNIASTNGKFQGELLEVIRGASRGKTGETSFPGKNSL